MRTIQLIILCISFVNTFAQVEVSTLTSEFKGSGGLSLDDDGNLYIGDFGDFLGGPDTDGESNHVMKLDTDLNLTQYSTGFIGASGNDFDNNGILFQSDIRDNAIYKIIDGVRTFVTSTGIVSPVGIVFDSNDNFFVCNCGNGTIQKVTPSGISSVFATGDFFSCPNGITVDEDDNLYVSNFSNTNIVKITPSGTTSVIGNTPVGNGHLDYDHNSRNLYIASYAGNQVFSLNIDNPILEVVAGTGIRGNNDGMGDVATFSTPNGVAISDDGNQIYINCAVPLTGVNINPQLIRLITLNNLSINENNNPDYKAKIFPVPANNQITVQAHFPANIYEIDIRIYQIDGKLVKKRYSSVNTSEIFNQSVDISNLSFGNYLYIVSSNGTHLFNGKFVKE